MLVYTLNGFCSALAGIAFSLYVMSGHGLYAPGFEMTVIAAVVIGGTMLTGGEGYVFGTLFGVLITGLIQFLIQFNGKLSSWWTSIAIGLLTLIFIGVQSLLSARKIRLLASKKLMSQAKQTKPLVSSTRLRNQRLLLGGGAILLVSLSVFAINEFKKAVRGPAAEAPDTTSVVCQLKPFRQDQAEDLLRGGAIIAYERNGGSNCIDELYGIYPDGRIVGDNGTEKIDKQVTSTDVDKLLSDIANKGWFTEEMYSTSHTPCGQCFTYYLSISYQGQDKTVKAVDGGTDAPADYWQVVSIINGVIPKFSSAP